MRKPDRQPFGADRGIADYQSLRLSGRRKQEEDKQKKSRDPSADGDMAMTCRSCLLIHVNCSVVIGLAACPAIRDRLSREPHLRLALRV